MPSTLFTPGSGSPDRVVKLGILDGWGEDADGNEGPYKVTLTVIANPSIGMAIELGLPVVGQPLLSVVEDYAPWEKHRDLIVEHQGPIVEGPIDGEYVRPYELPELSRVLHLHVLLQRFRHHHKRVHAVARWQDGVGLCSIHGFDPERGRFDDLKPAWDALREYEGIRSRPGPKPGTVKAQKYKTRSQWLAAIREHVMIRQTRVTADDWQFAEWLGISTSQLYVLMQRWGPPRTLNDLREGNF